MIHFNCGGEVHTYNPLIDPMSTLPRKYRTFCTKCGKESEWEFTEKKLSIPGTVYYLFEDESVNG